MAVVKDITGQRFGRLRVIRRSAAKSRQARWECLCECGATKTVLGTSLRNGTTRSCGCLRADSMAAVATTHGLHWREIATSQVWYRMRARCTNQRHPKYPRYGGRGITICERWQKFENFLADMGPRPSKKHSLDRIDNDGNYEPGNCRWATALEQVCNKSDIRLITFNGDTMPLQHWATKLGITAGALSHRLSKLPLDVAMTPGRLRSYGRGRRL